MMTESLLERIRAAIGTQYRIEQEIGRGGMSVVFRAHDLRLNRAVAVKVLPPDLAHDPAVASRFTREAQTSAQLAHPHIVPIFDVGARDGVAYFVMGLVTGGNVAAQLEQHPLRPIDEVRRVLAEVADALAYAHLRGVIHRDIKPDNILLDGESPRAMVTDFGIARAMEGGSRLTQTGIAVGTPTYMSPEQAVGERDIDGRSDVYSLGVVGYQMLTGRVPFSAGNSMAVLLKHVSEQPASILELRPETPRGLADAVERALAKAPGARWPTASAFRDALLAEDSRSQSWRSDGRDRVRYTSPIPVARRDATPASPRYDSSPVRRGETDPAVSMDSAAVARAPELTELTAEQRAELLLWDGRIDLLDRVRLMRRYAALTAMMAGLGLAGLVAGLTTDIPPLVLSPVVPVLMALKLLRRGQSLRESGLKVRRAFLSLRSRTVVAKHARAVASAAKPSLLAASNAPASLSPFEVSQAVLNGPHGPAIRRAAGDRVAIAELMAGMSAEDRALLPDVDATVAALYARAVSLAESVLSTEDAFDPALLADLDARLARSSAGAEGHAGAALAEEQRHVALLRHQRDALRELSARRAALERQIDNATLTLGNLRLDLMKLRTSGLQSALHDVSTATQEARALSREIAMALDVASEVREL